MKEENDLELCTQMNALRANHDLLNPLWRDGRLRAMADRLSYIQEAARAAEWRINEILRTRAVGETVGIPPHSPASPPSRPLGE